MKSWKSILVVGILGLSAQALAQNAPFTGTATVKLQGLDMPLVGETLRVRVTVDLTGVTGKDPALATIPVALGASVVPVRFDKKSLKFLEARGGTTTGFTQVPRATSLAGANGLGEVTLAAAAAGAARPNGAVVIGELRFQVLRGGRTTKLQVLPQGNVTTLSVASAYFPSGATAGPKLVPSKAGTPLSIVIPEEVASGFSWLVVPILALLCGSLLVLNARRRGRRWGGRALLLAGIAALGWLGASVHAAAPFIGDLNSSSVTDGADVTLLQDYLVANSAAVQSARVDLGDIDANGRIDAVDLALLRAALDQAKPLRPVVEIAANPNPAGAGVPVTLTWTSTRASSVTVNGGSQPPSGLLQVTPPSVPTVYTATAIGNGGVANAEVAIGKQSTFGLTAVPAAVEIPQSSFMYFVVGVSSADGFKNEVQLSVDGPAQPGVTFQFIPSRITPGATADLKVSVSAAATVNVHNFTIRAQGSSAGIAVNKTAPRSFTVLDTDPTTYSSGRVMTSDALPVPIPNATMTLRIGPSVFATAFTDAAGNYLFKNVTANDYVLRIDCRPAGPAGKYTFVHKAITVVDKQANPMPMPFLMPTIDTSDHINPPLNGSSCVSADTVWHPPSVPGMEVMFRAGTCLRAFGSPGTLVPQVSVTRLDVDRFPGLLPSVDADSVYTLQPEGTTASIPVEITYPNFRHMNAGTNVDLYALDIDVGMFVEIGSGTVSADGLSVVPDADPARPGYRFGLDHLTWSLSEAVVDANKLGGPAQCEKCQAADPVELTNGIFVMDWVDLEVHSGIGRAAVERTYRTRSIEKGPWGKGTSSNIDMVLVPGGPDPATLQQVTLRMPGGRDKVFTSQGGGVFSNVSHPDSIGDKITGGLSGGLLEIEFTSGETWGFEGLLAGPPSGRLAGRIRFQFDRNGNDTRIQRTDKGFPTRILEAGGRYIDVTWNEAAQGGAGLITKLTDTLGRQVLYTYDASERLKTITDSNGKVWNYAWDAAGNLKSITNPRGFLQMDNTYNAQGRVASQKRADAGVYTFAYTTSNPMDPNTTVIGTTATDPMGHARTFRFTAGGFVSELVDETGNKTVFKRDPMSNQIQSITDPLGRVTNYVYDPKNGLPATITDPNGGVTTYVYDPKFALPTSVEDPSGNTVTVEYDGGGNATKVTDPRGIFWTATYNSDGQLRSVKDPNNNESEFDYSSAGDLIEAKDGLGNAAHFSWDRAGRLSEFIDARDQITTFAYDGADRLTTRLLPGGAGETYTYDAVGNLTAIQDAKGNDWTMTYDNQNRVATATDPLGHQESFSYDKDDLVLTFIDRRGKVTTQTFDPRHLRTQVHPADGSTLSFQYDAAGRLTRAQDSLTEPVDLQYDVLDNLISEVTPSGIVKSMFDASSRRTQLQVGDDLPVGYVYVPDNFLLQQITQGADTYTFGYDSSARLISLARPNGVNTTYTYDAANRVTEIAHKMGVTTLEDILYEHDTTGRPATRTSVLPTLAPTSFQGGTHTASNQLVSFAGQTMQYDANGNLTSDGTLGYTYDARNRLVAVTGPGLTAEFAYDAMGRRISKTINGNTIRYVYSGLNVVQETSGIGSPVSIVSAGVDLWLARKSTDGASYFLHDDLGSVIGETDSVGALKTTYSYDPFGRTETAGAATSNVFRYTGRENDEGGLYFYRSRFYRPDLQRFTAEDPIRFDGGDLNLYAYVGSNPLLLTDPFGLAPAPPINPALSTNRGGLAGIDQAMKDNPSLAGNKKAVLNEVARSRGDVPCHKYSSELHERNQELLPNSPLRNVDANIGEGKATSIRMFTTQATTTSGNAALVRVTLIGS